MRADDGSFGTFGTVSAFAWPKLRARDRRP
jgi:hypothetical protein